MSEPDDPDRAAARGGRVEPLGRWTLAGMAAGLHVALVVAVFAIVGLLTDVDPAPAAGPAGLQTAAMVAASAIAVLLGMARALGWRRRRVGVAEVAVIAVVAAAVFAGVGLVLDPLVGESPGDGIARGLLRLIGPYPLASLACAAAAAGSIAAVARGTRST